MTSHQSWGFFCQGNSAETSQLNFVKLCIYEGYILCRCANLQEILTQFWGGGGSNYAPFNLRNLPKLNIPVLLKQFASATTLKPLNRTSWNFVIMKVIFCVDLHVCRKFWFNFFSRKYAPFELKNLSETSSLSSKLLWNRFTEFHGSIIKLDILWSVHIWLIFFSGRTWT